MAQRKSRRQEIGDDVRMLRARETFVAAKSPHGGDMRVHLAYPNSYWVGMSNLGFQAVYKILCEQGGVAVERAFLPDNAYEEEVFSEPWRTFESSRLLADCDVLGFSLSFETDYPHLLRMLRNCGMLDISARSRIAKADQAKFSRPLIIAGGTALTLNPEPVAPYIDLILIGEAEEFLPEFVSVLRTAREHAKTREELLNDLSCIEGAYVPGLFGDASMQFEIPRAARPRRRFVRDLSKYPTYSAILTPETEFRSMFLTETGRGCEMGCRFCVAGYIYRPVRKRSEESVAQSVEIGLQQSSAIGFVGAAVSSHRGIARLAGQVAERGGRASLSSLMAQKVSPELAKSLTESEYKTVALAPEAGTERLRRAAGKRVADAKILEAAEDLARAGIRGFKLYFIVGLPTERNEDVDAIAHLSVLVHERVKSAARDSAGAGAPWVVLSVNPFVPKASTPFQWEPMLALGELEEKIGRVKRLLRGRHGVEMHHESPKESYFQALLSRGDRSVAELLLAAENGGHDWKWTLREAGRRQMLARFVTRRFSFEEALPWEVVDSRIERALLEREARRAHEGDLPDANTPAPGDCSAIPGDFKGYGALDIGGFAQ